MTAVAETGIPSSMRTLIMKRKEFYQDVTSLRGELRFSLRATSFSMVSVMTLVRTSSMNYCLAAL
ncbi:MAG: hypothetical protein ABJQ63_07025 [Lentilitoribacter sp.]